MNYLQIGFAPAQFEYAEGALVISDHTDGILFDPFKHGLNSLPLKYRQAREFAAMAYPDKDLMTYRNGRRALTRLVMNADRLDRLHYRRNDDDKEAKGVVEDILLSPLLRRMFREPIPRWFNRGKTIHVHLDRKEIGDDDARIIANILISEFKGQIVIDDFGFYAREHHARLIREERLMARVNTLDELPERLRSRLMSMPKVGRGCIYDDAVELAKYDCKFPPGTDGYNSFIKASVEL